MPDASYVMLPILGPSRMRDGVGLGVNIHADPCGPGAGIHHESVASHRRSLVERIDIRRRNRVLDDLQKHAIDPYAELRALFRRHRAQELRHGEPAPSPDLEIPDQDPEGVPPWASRP